MINFEVSSHGIENSVVYFVAYNLVSHFAYTVYPKFSSKQIKFILLFVFIIQTGVFYGC